jgi:hypothetical protein
MLTFPVVNVALAFVVADVVVVVILDLRKEQIYAWDYIYVDIFMAYCITQCGYAECFI